MRNTRINEIDLLRFFAALLSSIFPLGRVDGFDQDEAADECEE